MNHVSSKIHGPEFGRLGHRDVLQFKQLTQLTQLTQRRMPCYADGWMYHLRSARKENGSAGYRFSGTDFFVTVGIRNNRVYCVSPLGNQRFLTVPAVCRTLCDRTGRSVILKKVDRQLSKYLLSRPGFSRPEKFVDLEDENFPEHALDLDQLFDSRSNLNSRAKQLNRRKRRFDRSDVRLELVTEFADCRSLLSLALDEMLADNQSKRLAYAPIFHYLQSTSSWPAGLFIGVFFDRSQSLHGFYLAEQLSRDCVGLYCGVNSRVYRDGTEWMDVEFFQKLRESGFRKVLLGGSETHGVHQYVQKLLPTTVEDQMIPLVYQP